MRQIRITCKVYYVCGNIFIRGEWFYAYDHEGD